MPGGKSVADEVEKTTLGQAWDDIEGHERDTGADHVLVVGIENAKVVCGAEVGGIRHFLETEGCKPVVDFRLGDGDDVETRLGGDDAQIARLGDHSFEAVEAGNEQIVEFEAFEILERGSLPKMETAGILSG